MDKHSGEITNDLLWNDCVCVDYKGKYEENILVLLLVICMYICIYIVGFGSGENGTQVIVFIGVLIVDSMNVFYENWFNFWLFKYLEMKETKG